MTTRLALYNGALLECGERDLASLSENREPRRLLDRVWDNGVVRYCLGRGQWKFAKRTIQMVPSTDIDPAFGYRHAFQQPEDFVRTIGLWSDEYLQAPLLQYQQEGTLWFADFEPLYLSYVSDASTHGGDLSLWSEEFARAVEIYLAARIVKKLTQSAEDEKFMLAKAGAAFREAASGDAMEGPTTFPPPGRWVQARHGGTSRDRGSRTSLIG